SFRQPLSGPTGLGSASLLLAGLLAFPSFALAQRTYLDFSTFQAWRALVPELPDARVCSLTNAGHRLWASGQLRMPLERFLHEEFRTQGLVDWAVELSAGPDAEPCEYLLVVTNEAGVWRRLLLERIELEEGSTGFTVVWNPQGKALGIDFGHRKRLTAAATMTWQDGAVVRSQPGYVVERRLIRQRCRWEGDVQRFRCSRSAVPEEWDLT
ncbi:MAG: hypothetical protein ACRENB_13620, partial [Gemmatimonadales bacterium]